MSPCDFSAALMIIELSRPRPKSAELSESAQTEESRMKGIEWSGEKRRDAH